MDWGWSKGNLIPPPSLITHAAQSTGSAVIPLSATVIENSQFVVVSYINHGLFFLWHILPRTARLGRSTVSSDGNVIVVSNLYDGFDMYDVRSRGWLKTLTIPISENVPLPVLITHDLEELFLGSPSGHVRVYDFASVEEELILEHNDEMIQTMACCGVKDTRLLATGPSERGKNTVVSVWQRTDKPLEPDVIPSSLKYAFRGRSRSVGPREELSLHPDPPAQDSCACPTRNASPVRSPDSPQSDSAAPGNESSVLNAIFPRAVHSLEHAKQYLKYIGYLVLGMGAFAIALMHSPPAEAGSLAVLSGPHNRWQSLIHTISTCWIPIRSYVGAVATEMSIELAGIGIEFLTRALPYPPSPSFPPLPSLPFLPSPSFPPLPSLPFLPSRLRFATTQSLVLKNFSQRFLKHNILDVKLGTVFYDDSANAEKQRERRRAFEDITEIRATLAEVHMRMGGGSLLFFYEADWERAREWLK
ncbi:hypothetical protein L227DRAFT_605647 [Lentinus tigrinus ALCF2SS1-6]|uniref:Kinase n=1 Tax=Lentinus tigrinus ALCF2SS1-6 TaxID=1328759 RepID=A0A5C2SW26_9APHY|nr:hypothetical protein L227DRAFT_605647 [Lentinus tigrinus ALCF2SS1-6]